ncbi:MAG: hypothetical protein HUU37_03595, partial [Bdellovibrionales bacterium]|nr:hypothetical protein [Bdellovibrionales bacterium]
MLRVIFVLFFFLAPAAEASVPPLFEIGSPGARWKKMERPLPGLQSVYLNGDNSSISVLKDSSATLYTDLDTYVSHALRIVREQREQAVLDIKTLAH